MFDSSFRFISEAINKVIAYIHRHPALGSFLHTLWTELLFSEAVAAAADHIFSTGDFSKKALYAFGYAVFRTVFHSIRASATKKAKAVAKVEESKKEGSL